MFYYKSVIRTRFLSLAVLAALLITAACYKGTRPPRVNSPAPDFSLTENGKTVSLSSLRGHVVVLNFWATWCPPCIDEMPSLIEMQKRLKNEGVQVLAVSLDVDQSAYEDLIRKMNIDLLTVRDPDQKSNAMYGTFRFPETYVIDRQGVLRRKFVGPVNWTEAEIEKYLTSL